MDSDPAPVGVISPHLDDAVLSVAHVLGAHPGSLVVTVFSGGPGSVDPLPPWDRSSGCFHPGDDVMAARRDEDLAAASSVGAEAVHLGFWDFQYRSDGYGFVAPAGGLDAALAAAMETIVRAAGTAAGRDRRWLVPLGILHPDHIATSEAALAVARRVPELDWLVYEELPYHVAYPGERAAAMRRLADAGLELTDVALDTGTVDKATAVACYASQVPALGAGVEQAVAGPEMVHRLVLGQ